MDISTNTNASLPSLSTGTVLATPAQTPTTQVDNTASAAKTETYQAATQLFQTKSEASSDMQQLQKDMAASVSQLNQMLQSNGRNLSIGIDNAVDGPVVTVRDTNTGDVVRQIPNETVVQIAHSIDSFKGWLQDVKV